MTILEQIRDIAVIVLALFGTLQFLVVLLVAFMLYRKVGPLLDSARTTMNNVQGTTAFVTETTVSPVIKILSFITGMRTAAERLSQFRNRKGGKE